MSSPQQIARVDAFTLELERVNTLLAHIATRLDDLADDLANDQPELPELRALALVALAARDRLERVRHQAVALTTSGA